MSVNGDTRGAAMGIDGAMVQMISHGLISGALFFCVGVLYDRVHSREISAYGGVVNTMPIFAAFAVLFALANSGLPATSGFVGEFLVIIASFRADFWYAFLAGLTLILGAAYTLWLVKRVIFGAVANDHVAALTDVNAREFIVLGVLAVAVLLLGLWPAPLLEVMRPTVENLVQQITAQALKLSMQSGPEMGGRQVGGGGDLRRSTAMCVILARRRVPDAIARAGSRTCLSLLTLAGAACMTVRYGVQARVTAFDGMFVADPMGDVLKLFSYGTVAVAFLYSREYLQRRGLFKGEYFVLALVALLGVDGDGVGRQPADACISASSCCRCRCTRWSRSTATSGVAAESAMKYFVLGAIASGTLLYGFSIVYGVTGTLQLDELAVGVREVGAAQPRPDLRPGVHHRRHRVQVRRRAVPHVGAGRLSRRADAGDAVHRLGAEDRVVRARDPRARRRARCDGRELAGHADRAGGAVDAHRQRGRDRADEPQAHAGVLDDLARRLHPARHPRRHDRRLPRVDVLHADLRHHDGRLLRHDPAAVAQGFEADQLEDFKGLNRTSPWFAAIMMMLMFSTAGVPPFVGFWAKLAVIGAVLDVGLAWLAAVAVVLSVVGGVLLPARRQADVLRRADRQSRDRGGGTLRAVLSANGVAVLALGVFPSALIDLCARVLP